MAKITKASIILRYRVHRWRAKRDNRTTPLAGTGCGMLRRSPPVFGAKLRSRNRCPASALCQDRANNLAVDARNRVPESDRVVRQNRWLKVIDGKPPMCWTGADIAFDRSAVAARMGAFRRRTELIRPICAADRLRHCACHLGRISGSLPFRA
jgi:hypothetical protein